MIEQVKWNRKLGTSKREQGIATPKKHEPYNPPTYLKRHSFGGDAGIWEGMALVSMLAAKGRIRK